MKMFGFWKNRLIIAPKNKIVYKARYKLTKYQRRELRRFLRTNGIFGAIITDVEIKKGICNTDVEMIHLFNLGKLRQV